MFKLLFGGVGDTVLLVAHSIEDMLRAKSWVNLYYANSHLQIIVAVAESVGKTIGQEHSEYWAKSSKSPYLNFRLRDFTRR